MHTEQLYRLPLRRYVTALRNERPEQVPVRPFVAEFVGKYAGYTCQEITHDYLKAFDAVIKTGQGFDWDAMICNMVWAWTVWENIDALGNTFIWQGLLSF